MLDYFSNLVSRSTGDKDEPNINLIVQEYLKGEDSAVKGMWLSVY